MADRPAVPNTEPADNRDVYEWRVIWGWDWYEDFAYLDEAEQRARGLRLSGFPDASVIPVPSGGVS